MYRKFVLAACTALSSLLSGGCCFDLDSGPKYFMYADMFGPPAASVVMWPVDAEGERFRYTVTDPFGELRESRPISEVGSPPDKSFDRQVPEDVSHFIVLLPAHDLVTLRPQAQRWLDHLVALRPGVMTSIAPVKAEMLERPLDQISDVEGLEASVAHAYHLYRLQRPTSLGELFMALTWVPALILIPLETEPGADGGGGIAVIDLQDCFNQRGQSDVAAPRRIVDWDGCFEAIEEIRARQQHGTVEAWVLEPADASEELRARVERLMDGIAELDGDWIAWQRAVVESELPPDADAERVVWWVFNGLRNDPAVFREVEVRLRYDPARVEPDFTGRFVPREDPD